MQLACLYSVHLPRLTRSKPSAHNEDQFNRTSDASTATDRCFRHWLLNAANVSAQGPGPGTIASPPPEPSGATAEVERVIVTGSNIPTAEEVGPNPVDTYRSEDIRKLGALTPTNLVQRLPAITGAAVNENIGNGGDGRTEVNLRGLFPKRR
jgi:hypothetical protein